MEFEVAGSLGLRPHPLHRVEQVVGLRQHRVAELLGPVDVIRHAGKHVGEPSGKNTHALVPILEVHEVGALLVRQAGGFLEEAVALHHVERKGRGNEHLGEQRVGVKGHRCHEIVERISGEQALLRRQRRQLLRRRRRGASGRGGGGSVGS